MTVRIAAALPPSKGIVDYARAAESLGCDRVWVYDSPALYTDVWVALARIAEATDRVGVATGVAVPSLRHPLVTASAIATIEELAPGRLTVAMGTGFTARMAMGRKPMRWADLATYLRQLRGLLAGEVVEVEGRPCQMIHPDGWAPARPIHTPLWVAPTGPKGFATAGELGVDGVILVTVPSQGTIDFPDAALLVNGTVLRPGEDHLSPRVVEAAGPWFATSFHAMWEYAPDALDLVPGGTVWREGMLATGRSEGERHLAVHEGHVTIVTGRDRAAINAAGDAIVHSGWTGPPQAVREKVAEAESAGVREIVYAPTGPDIPGEIECFVEAVRA